MSASQVEVDDVVHYYEWDAAQGTHNKYRATVRTVPGAGHAVHRKIHMNVSAGERNAGFRTVNNVENIEEAAPDGDLTGLSYWAWISEPV